MEGIPQENRKKLIPLKRIKLRCKTSKKKEETKEEMKVTEEQERKEKMARQKKKWNDWWAGATKLKESRANSPQSIPIQKKVRKKSLKNSLEKKKEAKKGLVEVQEKKKQENGGRTQVSLKDLIQKFGGGKSSSGQILKGRARTG